MPASRLAFVFSAVVSAVTSVVTAALFTASISLGAPPPSGAETVAATGAETEVSGERDGAISGERDAAISGELKLWHRVTLSFEGPETSEQAAENPFLNYRLTVTFQNGGRERTVPGFFAVDGRAGASGAESGSTWRVHFMPDEVGEWTYTASFRRGPDVAVSLDPYAGYPVDFDGASGSFVVGASDKSGRDLRAKGLLRHVGKRYLQHAGTGEYFLKGGPGSPENLLAYHDFDGTWDRGGPEQPTLEEGLHRYGAHEVDWKPGDPAWREGKGKGLVGGLNYLAAKGMNTLYFLTMNVDGDGDDVWPWIAPRTQDRFDVSKLDQWEIVFSHMDSLGIAMNMLMQETENDTLFDDGELGRLRKVYYRELVARFGHHPAVTYNLGEETNHSTRELVDFAGYIRALDPYDHPVVVHNHVHLIHETYDPLLGHPDFDGVSFQVAHPADVHWRTIQYVDASRAADRPWFVPIDEVGHFSTGLTPDGPDDNHDQLRYEVLWGNLMAGGSGVEWYFGYQHPHADLNLEDWRSRDAAWEWTRHGLEFFHTYLPYERMHHGDNLTWEADDYVFAEIGEVYAIYLPVGRDVLLELKDYGDRRFRIQWYDPREGGALLDGTLTEVQGGSPTTAIGGPPAPGRGDWVALVRRIDPGERP